jgi:excisionase family DNA binding protein
MASDLVSIGEAAAILGVSIPTLRRWDRLGHLPSVRLAPGSPRRYSRADLDAFLKAAS